MSKHSRMLCMFASCFEEVKAYVNSCVFTELSKNVLNTVPVLCEASGGRENEYCLESAMQLFHVSAAVLRTGSNGALVNVSLFNLI